MKKSNPNWELKTKYFKGVLVKKESQFPIGAGLPDFNTKEADRVEILYRLFSFYYKPYEWVLRETLI